MRTAERSTLLWLMGRGMYLSLCTEYTEERIKMIEEKEAEKQQAGQKVKQIYLNKKPEEIARRLLNACAQYVVAERLAEEWDFLGSEIRMKFTDLANAGWRSGNKTKGLLRVDKMLGGKILRRQYVEDVGVLRERDGKTFVDFRKAATPTVDPKYRFATLPKDFHTWSPARKRKYNEQLARERRAV